VDEIVGEGFDGLSGHGASPEAMNGGRPQAAAG
jgi:hypothetical protein